VRASIASFTQMAGWRARLRLLGAKLGPRIGRGRGQIVALPVKELDGRPLHVRPGTADMNTIFLNYVQGAHLPPPPFVDRDLRQICELGSQIGTGIAGLAARYSHARVIGVEPDPENAALARRNIEEHMGTVVEPIDPTRGAQLNDRIHATPELMATLSPLIGMLLRTRTEAVAV